MKLSRQDATLFFELMWALQYFVNRQLRLLPDIDTLEAYRDCSREEKMQVRRALYDNIELIDAFTEENPERLPRDQLAIIAPWKHFVADEFYIERLLKKYAIFISTEQRVYGVLALHDAFQDILHPGQFPFLVKAVLLPFKGKIIYDGLLEGYNVYFGGGIRAELKEAYLAAKQQGRIIESLDPEQPQVKSTEKAVKDWRPELDALLDQAKNLRGGADQPPLNSPAFGLIKTSLEFAQTAVEHPDDLARLWSSLKKVKRALQSVERILYRAEKY